MLVGYCTYSYLVSFKLKLDYADEKVGWDIFSTVKLCLLRITKDVLTCLTNTAFSEYSK